MYDFLNVQQWMTRTLAYIEKSSEHCYDSSSTEENWCASYNFPNPCHSSREHNSKITVYFVYNDRSQHKAFEQVVKDVLTWQDACVNSIPKTNVLGQQIGKMMYSVNTISQNFGHTFGTLEDAAKITFAHAKNCLKKTGEKSFTCKTNLNRGKDKLRTALKRGIKKYVARKVDISDWSKISLKSSVPTLIYNAESHELNLTLKVYKKGEQFPWMNPTPIVLTLPGDALCRWSIDEHNRVKWILPSSLDDHVDINNILNNGLDVEIEANSTWLHTLRKVAGKHLGGAQIGKQQARTRGGSHGIDNTISQQPTRVADITPHKTLHEQLKEKVGIFLETQRSQTETALRKAYAQMYIDLVKVYQKHFALQDGDFQFKARSQEIEFVTYCKNLIVQNIHLRKSLQGLDLISWMWKNDTQMRTCIQQIAVGMRNNVMMEYQEVRKKYSGEQSDLAMHQKNILRSELHTFYYTKYLPEIQNREAQAKAAEENLREIKSREAQAEVRNSNIPLPLTTIPQTSLPPSQRVHQELPSLDSIQTLDELHLTVFNSTQPVGKGGQGSVYTGKYNGQLVAVKEYQSRCETHLLHNMQLTEIKVMEYLRRLNGHHHNIVEFKGIVRSRRRLFPKYVVMELCEYSLDKQEFKDMVYNGVQQKIDREEHVLKPILRDVARALAFIHSKGVIHNDIKPANILVQFEEDSELPTYKLADFGIACIIDNQNQSEIVRKSIDPSSNGSRENTGTISTGVGTSIYMAPELLSATSESIRVTPAVDMYAFGVLVQTLWHTLCISKDKKEIHAWENERDREVIVKLHLNSKSINPRLKDKVVDQNLRPTNDIASCPEPFKELSTECWKCEPSQRMTAQQVFDKLTESVPEINTSIQVSPSVHTNSGVVVSNSPPSHTPSSMATTTNPNEPNQMNTPHLAAHTLSGQGYKSVVGYTSGS